MCPKLDAGRGNGNGAERRKTGKAALAAGGRGARKELGMPVTGNRLRLKNRGGGPDLDQHDHGRSDGYGRCRVHHDAQRATVGIGVHLVNVRHLDHGQQRQQDNTHNGGQRQS